MAEELLDPKRLAEHLGVPLATVYQMNSRGTGPRRIRVGKHVRYRESDVTKWLERHAVDPEPVG